METRLISTSMMRKRRVLILTVLGQIHCRDEPKGLEKVAVMKGEKKVPPSEVRRPVIIVLDALMEVVGVIIQEGQRCEITSSLPYPVWASCERNLGESNVTHVSSKLIGKKASSRTVYS
jgi:hypothetical protein